MCPKHFPNPKSQICTTRTVTLHPKSKKSQNTENTNVLGFSILKRPAKKKWNGCSVADFLGDCLKRMRWRTAGKHRKYSKFFWVAAWQKNVISISVFSWSCYPNMFEIGAVRAFLFEHIVSRRRNGHCTFEITGKPLFFAVLLKRMVLGTAQKHCKYQISEFWAAKFKNIAINTIYWFSYPKAQLSHLFRQLFRCKSFGQ